MAPFQEMDSPPTYGNLEGCQGRQGNAEMGWDPWLVVRLSSLKEDLQAAPIKGLM